MCDLLRVVRRALFVDPRQNMLKNSVLLQTETLLAISVLLLTVGETILLLWYILYHLCTM